MTASALEVRVALLWGRFGRKGSTGVARGKGDCLFVSLVRQRGRAELSRTSREESRMGI